MNKLVISGINMIDGGALSIYLDFLDEIIKQKKHLEYEIIIFVGKKELFEKYSKDITIIELPKSKRNWLYRIYYEYMFFYKFSKKENIDTWISMHDITPRVIAKKQYVYCHNPSPFNNMKLSEIKYGIKYYLFSKFYKYLYKINIRKNTAVIVQQNWIKEEFEKMYKINNVIVAKPSIKVDKINVLNVNEEKNNNKNIFIYPSYPRYYKKFELACKAVEYLVEQKKINNFELWITLDGTENIYSRELKNKYGRLIENIKFLGIQNRKKLYSLYEMSSCLIFVSKLETWGLPIIEYKEFGKPMILANLPYALETCGDYKRVAFVDINNHIDLANEMEKIINGIIPEQEKQNKRFSCLENWYELVEKIL